MGEFASMLYWTMLAACTVGPGTVVTCSRSVDKLFSVLGSMKLNIRAGAEFELSLIWALVVAGLIAFTLQVKSSFVK